MAASVFKLRKLTLDGQINPYPQAFPALPGVPKEVFLFLHEA